MNLFKNYKNKSTEWKSGFSEHRDSKPNFVPYYIPSFSELRDGSYINEESYDKSFHDDPEIAPERITPTQSSAIRAYSCAKSNERDGYGSSKNINGYLFNRVGFHNRGVLYHPVDKVENSIDLLQSAFIKNNTNGKEVKTFSAIPHDIGHMLMKSNPGDIHIFPGFTSTSSDVAVANNFSFEYTSHPSNMNKEHHIVHYTLKPHTGLSIVDHSLYQNENEVLLDHGAHVEYHKTEFNPIKNLYTHHVTVNTTKTNLEEYGDYNHDKFIGHVLSDPKTTERMKYDMIKSDTLKPHHLQKIISDSASSGTLVGIAHDKYKEYSDGRNKAQESNK